MIDYLIMGLILGFLMITLLIGVKEDHSESHFFDLNNSKALRGFWCLIVILVHIPAAYQNKIQDMVGSFAFIGVTFFFMTSGYGLTLSTEKKQDASFHFWRKRLPKLLIPNWLINICFAVVSLILFSQKITWSVLDINIWVKWLLGCYFLFWLSQKLKKYCKWDIFVIVGVAIVSIIFYILKMTEIISSTTWEVECLGFVWGILLAKMYSKFVRYFKDSWIKKWIGCLALALIIGVLYLKFKPVIFFGDYLLKILLGIVITMFMLIANVKLHIGNKINLFLGEISFEVYLIHGKVFHLLADLVPKLSSGIFILASLVLTVILAWLFHLLSKKILKILPLK